MKKMRTITALLAGGIGLAVLATPALSRHGGPMMGAGPGMGATCTPLLLVDLGYMLGRDTHTRTFVTSVMAGASSSRRATLTTTTTMIMGTAAAAGFIGALSRLVALTGGIATAPVSIDSYTRLRPRA
jgi:hypothetical protein